jgi:UDP-N-acetylglucosamine acyltransferase
MTQVHATAIVASGAELADEVSVGPYCVIGPHVKLGRGTRIESHVVIEGHTTIGANCRIWPFATIGTQSQDVKFKGGVSYVEVGDNTLLREYVTINAATREGDVTRVGSECFLLAYCHVAHGCRVGNQVTMSNGATLGGDAVVEDQAIVGGLTGVHQFCRIGRLCMVGACSKVVKDLPPFTLADGSPADVRGVNRIGMERRGLSEETRKVVKDAYRIVFREGLAMADAVAAVRERIPAIPEVVHFLTFIENTERGIAR